MKFFFGGGVMVEAKQSAFEREKHENYAFKHCKRVELTIWTA